MGVVEVAQLHHLPNASADGQNAIELAAGTDVHLESTLRRR
jgi:hypothetical protein